MKGSGGSPGDLGPVEDRTDRRSPSGVALGAEQGGAGAAAGTWCHPRCCNVPKFVKFPIGHTVNYGAVFGGGQVTRFGNKCSLFVPDCTAKGFDETVPLAARFKPFATYT